MKEIHFTIGESNVWHVIKADFDMFNELQVGQVVASIIVNEMKLMQKETTMAKRVIIKDESGKVIAESSDITKVEYLTFKNE